MKNLHTFLFIILPLLAWGQRAAVGGKIADAETGQYLAGVSVTLDGQTGISTENGSFYFAGLSAGTHLLRVSIPGYTTQERQLTLREGETLQADFQLETGNVALNEITVQAAGSHQRGVLSQIDIRLRPILNSQEILRMVPGLFMGQHAGGGKAEQIFLRGFDIDHGTDIQLTVDGMPVNMVSHAHGQGYADLHFVIPELVEQVNFEKGPYRADKGNFVTAGWVDFRTRETLDRSFAKLELGQYGTARSVLGLDLLGKKSGGARNQSAYLAGEYSYSDSYFDAPQFFNRANVQGKYNIDLTPATRLNLSASHFWSRWNHSGQIPDRAVASGLIGFYGAIDPSEGGETSRSNFNVQLLTQTGGGGLLKNQFFYSNYNFELYSNFTFFLEDSINGDQIRQKEGRNLLGYTGSFTQPNRIGGLRGRFQAGVQYRQDWVNDVELSHTRNRSITESNIQLGDVREANVATYLSEELELSSKITLELGLRYDHFFNRYTDRLQDNQTANAQAGIVSPKLNVSYTSSKYLQWYLNAGRGFHSNDTRVAVPQDGRDILPPAYGSDLGAVWKPLPRLYVNTALWYLWLEQEFVYVGDAGVVEPGGRTRRWGADLSVRYQLTKHLFADIDVNWTNPRAIGEPSDANFLPLAPRFTTVGGLSLSPIKGFSGSLRYRYMADRLANEDNSIVAEGYFVPDLQLNYRFKSWELGFNVQNLLNTQWKETQFATLSRLQNEPEGVEEIHFTPGTPIFARIALTKYF
ncbi:MAG: TonB-dependent receptor [Chitinophagales bacterium]|nr:TonB-dependent receptor [Chitinophagales bacterium]